MPSHDAHAQSDAGVWLEAGVKHKVNRKLRLSLDQHLRFENNASEVVSVMPELGASYRLNKRLRLGAGYRLAYKRTGSGDFEWRHRFQAEARASHRYNKLRLRYRLRFQETLGAKDGARYAIRNRLTLKRPLNKRTTPGIALELFHKVGDGDARLGKLRLTAGVAREFGKRELEVFYRIETAQDDPSDPTMHILGLGFHMPI